MGFLATYVHVFEGFEGGSFNGMGFYRVWGNHGEKIPHSYIRFIMGTPYSYPGGVD